MFGSVIVESAYDFSVDVLMLAFFAQALAAICDGRGLRAGLLVGLCVVIKPTALMLLPSLALLFFERAQTRELARSLGTGTPSWRRRAGLNTWMYGRPWWSGYNRTLVTVRGEPTVADHATRSARRSAKASLALGRAATGSSTPSPSWPSARPASCG